MVIDIYHSNSIVKRIAYWFGYRLNKQGAWVNIRILAKCSKLIFFYC